MTLETKTVIVGGCAIAVAAGGIAVWRMFRRHLNQRQLQAALDAYLAARRTEFEAIRQQLDSLDETQKKRLHWIQGLSYQLLKGALKNQETTAVEVLQTYQLKALRSHQKTNCLCRFVQSAQQRAHNLDLQYRDKPKPPLFGIPFSVKENIQVAGCLCTRGYVRALVDGRPSENDAVLVQVLVDAGGVPFVTTNLPQTVLTFACSNPIYGTTTNPYSSARTSGGSSGGEAALIGSGGSLFGVGSDVAGSVRVPSVCSGICGLKPTSKRMSQKGIVVSTPGRPFIEGSLGILAADAHILTDVNRLIFNSQLHSRDCYVPSIPFDDRLLETDTKLTVGYYVNDGWFEASQCHIRAVTEAAEGLRSLGHTLVPWQPPNAPMAYQLVMGAVLMDGGEYLLKELRNDVPEPSHMSFYNGLSTPKFLKHLMALFMDARPAAGVFCTANNTAELRALYERIQKYRQEVRSSFETAGLDALLCPPMAVPPMPPWAPLQMLPSYLYTALFNLLDYPAGVVPWGRVTQTDEEAMLDYPLVDPIDRYSLLARRCSVTGTVGLPVAVQVATPPFCEEICLRLLNELEQLRGSANSVSFLNHTDSAQ